MLWGFEALRIFGDKLKKSLDIVEGAGEKVKTLLEIARKLTYYTPKPS